MTINNQNNEAESSATPPYVVELVKVTKTFKDGSDQVFALNSIRMQIVKGEIVAIVGPSGSGKTTLANICAGIDVATAGRVILDGQDIQEFKDAILIFENIIEAYLGL